jgi:serine/threonine protein kinase
MSSIKLIPTNNILAFTLESGVVIRPAATVEIQHIAPLSASSWALAAFKLKLNNVRRYTVSKKCGWIHRGETIKIRIELITHTGDKLQQSTDLFSVEILFFNDIDEMNTFVSTNTGKEHIRNGSSSGIKSPSDVAERIDPALLWTFLKSERRKQTIYTALLPVESISPLVTKSSPLRGVEKEDGNGQIISGSPPSRSFGSSRNLLASSIPHGQGIGWRKGPLIGRGAFGMVHVGVITSINSGQSSFINRGTLVALKEIPLATPLAWPAAFREATALTACSGHQNIPRLFALRRLPPSHDQPLERALLIMELVSGGTLAQFATAWANKGRSPMARGVIAAGNNADGSSSRSKETGGMKEREEARGLPENIVCAYIRELLNALEHVHARGLAHRDVKGANLLLSSTGKVMLADFGSCKLSWDPENTITSPNAPPISSPLAGGTTDSSQKGITLGASGEGQNALKSAREQGTLQWMAPEVVTVGLKLGVFQASNSPGSQNLGSSSSSPNGTTGSPSSSSSLEVDSLGWWQRADVWSVGCTTIELLTARPPWFGIANDSAEVMLHMASTDLRDTIPSWFSDEAKFFIRACLHPNAAARPTPSKLLSLPFVSLSGLGKPQEGECLDDDFSEQSFGGSIDITSELPQKPYFIDSDFDDTPTKTFDETDIIPGGVLDIASSMATTARISDPVNSPQTLECSPLPIESLQRASKSIVRIIPLLMLSCRKTYDWATRRTLKPSGPSANLLSRCACTHQTINVSSLHSLAETYSSFLNDDEVALTVAHEIEELVKNGSKNCVKIPHSFCSEGFLFGNWNTNEEVAKSNSCEGTFLNLLSRARYEIRDLVANDLEVLLLNLIHQRVSAWVSIPLRSNPNDEIVGLFSQPDRQQKNMSAILRTGSLSGLAIITAWHIAAMERLNKKRNQDNYTNESHLFEGKNDEDEWYITSTDGPADIGEWYSEDNSEDNEDCPPNNFLFDPAYTTTQFAKLHVWALELSNCFSCILALRESRNRGTIYHSRLSSTFSWIERRVFARWLWFIKSWNYCSILVGIESNNDGRSSSKEDDSEDELL